MKLQRLWLPTLGFTVILAVCARPWVASIYNRNGTPESILRLSERELELPTGKELDERENAAVTLHLAWRIEATGQVDSAAAVPSATQASWITRSKVVNSAYRYHGQERAFSFSPR